MTMARDALRTTSIFSGFKNIKIPSFNQFTHIHCFTAKCQQCWQNWCKRRRLYDENDRLNDSVLRIKECCFSDPIKISLVYTERTSEQEEFEDTKGVIGICKSKDRQLNGQKKKGKKSNNHLQSTTHKTKIE
jgi:hypothetical protein